MHADDHPRRSRSAQGIAWVFAVLTVLGCAGEPPPEAQIGAGPTWTASIRRENSGELCLEVQSSARPVSTLCNIETAGTSTWRADAAPGEVLITTSDEAGASSAVVRMADGSELPVELVQAPDVTTLGIFVVALPVRPVPTDLFILAADGGALEIVPLNDP